MRKGICSANSIGLLVTSLLLGKLSLGLGGTIILLLVVVAGVLGLGSLRALLLLLQTIILFVKVRVAVLVLGAKGVLAIGSGIRALRPR